MEQMPEVGHKVAAIIDRLMAISLERDEAFPFMLVLNDPAGNSFLENPFAPAKDPNIRISTYLR
jgi:zinc finger protein